MLLWNVKLYHFLFFSLVILILGAFMIVYTEDIIGQTSNMNKTDHGSCQTIDVWVPKKEGFTEFVVVNEQSVVEGGFSIAIFCRALSLLPYNVTPIFKSFVNSEGKSNGTAVPMMNL